MGNADVMHGGLINNTYEAVIFGAGISGLVSAAILLERGLKNILIIDEYPHIGGNHISTSIGDMTFDVGSFIFQDNSDLLKYFPDLRPLYIPIRAQSGRISPRGAIKKYPFSVEDEVIKAGPREWIRIALSLGFARLFRRRIRNAQDYAEYWIGRRLMKQSGLGYFMERFYGVPPANIETQFAQARMRWIRENAVVRKRIYQFLRPARPAYRPQQQLVRPKEGFDYLYRTAADYLKRRGVKFLLGAKLVKVDREGDGFAVRSAIHSFHTARVISTIPIRTMLKLCGLPTGEPLKTVTLLSLFYSFQGDRGFGCNVLYNFTATGAWKRLTVHSDFYGTDQGREFFTVEVNANHVDGSIEKADKDFRKHALAHGLYSGELRLEGSYLLENAYPIYVDEASSRATECIRVLKDFGIESFGRQGGFDYQPTAQISIQAAKAALLTA